MIGSLVKWIGGNFVREKVTTSVREYVNDTNVCKRYIRPKEAAVQLEKTEEEVLKLASMAGAICRLPVITLICCKRLEDYMKHLYKVSGTNKYVQKKYVRIGEGSIMYSIGRHRFVEMARAAGAVYKVNGGTVLVSLDIFDEYMEQFREKLVDMKNPLWNKEVKEGK